LKWVSERDEGQSDALNKGIRMSTGGIIGWLNSDDLYLPGALQKVTSYFDAHPGCGWLYGRCKIVDEEDREIRKWITLYKNLLSGKFSYPLLLTENFISQPAVFFRRKTFEQAGSLNSALPLAMDYDLWLRMAQLGPPGVLNDDLACFRVHEKAKSAQFSRQQFIEQYEIHKRYDQRKFFLFLHRINLARTIAGYWVISKLTSKPPIRQTD
jgi:GT2 family glycosyltransferase